jgi:Mg-chelatase subunit ChlD
MDQAIASKLSEYDFIVVIDKSGSMGDPVKRGSDRSRWAAMQESVGVFVRDIQALDDDGIDIVLFGGQSIQAYEGVTAAKLADVWAENNPRGGTPLAEALQKAFALAGKSAKKDFVLVFTDGVPDDASAAAKVLKDQANKQETDDACTVLFVQVGDNAEATVYLRGLDDNLKGAKFDIVDAKTMDEADKFATTAELVLAAIND